jgi:hypothetical protein
MHRIRRGTRIYRGNRGASRFLPLYIRIMAKVGRLRCPLNARLREPGLAGLAQAVVVSFFGVAAPGPFALNLRFRRG